MICIILTECESSSLYPSSDFVAPTRFPEILPRFLFFEAKEKNLVIVLFCLWVHFAGAIESCYFYLF